jgi:hypothetical protein
MLTNKIYSSEVLDTQYEVLLKERLDFLKKKYTERELRLISFEDLSLMGDFLSTVKPISHTRKHKKTLLKYADIYVEMNKDKLKNKKFVLFNTRDYLLEISKYLEKFDFKYKNTWTIIVQILLLIEVVVFLFFQRSSYILPIITVIVFCRAKLSEHKAQKEGKLLKFISRM